jgi:uncharacterized protein
MPHRIVHIEFPAEDHVAAGRFYGTLFGWQMQDFPEMGYTMFDGDDGPGGGFAVINGESVREGEVVIFVETADIDATLARVAALGGEVITQRSEIPGYGWFGIFRDPSGNRVALFAEN